MESKTWTKEDISAKLQTSDAWVVRAVIAIYERQTADEQATMTTNHHNNVGYNGVDAEIMSSFAQQAQRRGSLSPKQLVIARKKIMKYAGQLASIANEAVEQAAEIEETKAIHAAERAETQRVADEKWNRENALLAKRDTARMDEQGMLWA